MSDQTSEAKGRPGGAGVGGQGGPVGGRQVDSFPAANLAAALALAARGWPVLPVCWPKASPDGRVVCGCGQGHTRRDIGKAPVGRLVPHGHHDATTDEAIIRRWWAACPNANVGVALDPAGLVAIDCDSEAALDYARTRGVPATVVRLSRMPAYIYRRPPGCPAVRRTPAPGLDILADGYLVVWGRHPAGCDIRLEPWPPEPAPAPAWAVEALKDAARRAELKLAADGADVEPPVRLVGDALRLWKGELLIPKGGEHPAPAGEVPAEDVDRSRTLFHIALALARAGATERTVAEAVAERDRGLGLDKYAARRDGEIRYAEIAKKAVEAAAGGLRPRLRRGTADPALSKFPTDALPEPLRGFVRQAADALVCPPEFVAAPLLAATGALVGNRVRIVITPEWSEIPTLWVAVVGNPGTGKTPAMELALEPLRRLQEEAMAAWRAELEAYEAELAAFDRAQRRREGAPDAPARRPERPEPEHFFTTDSTLEGLHRILGHPRSRTPGVLVYRDELVGWVQAFDNYRHGGERQALLSAWASVALKVDRAGRDPYWVARPVISVAGGVVPDLLSRLEAEAGALDGFIDRFLWAWPDCEPAPLSTRRVDEEVREEVIAACRLLRRVPEGTVGLSGEAFGVFEGWHELNRERLAAAAGLWAGILAKLPRQLARLALCLHVWRHPDWPSAEPVTADTMEAAVALVEFFTDHARRVVASFGLRALVSDPKALRVYDALQEAGELNLRELNDRTGLSGTELRLAVAHLVRAGLVEVEQPAREGPGRPPTLVRVLVSDPLGNLSKKSNLSPGYLSADQAMEGEDGG